MKIQRMRALKDIEVVITVYVWRANFGEMNGLSIKGEAYVFVEMKI